MPRKTMDLAEFIRSERGVILQKWQLRVRGDLAAAHDQNATALLDHLPDLLETIARTAEGDADPASAQVALSARHAAERLEQGYGLAEVVKEYLELRSCIFERLEELEAEIAPKQSRRLHRAIDQALGEAARRYVTSHERMLRAMDRLVGKSGPRRALDQTLSDILSALKETVGADVDSIAIFLLEDDRRLHLRATIGLEGERESKFSLSVGEGFVGRIAETCKPRLLQDAANDSLVVSPTIRTHGTCALYGVPLVDEGRAIGVAHMGSCTAHYFSDEDMMLFRAMCDRATMAIVRARFIDTLERTAHFREQFIAVLGHDLRSPLGTILGTAQFLLAHEDIPKERVCASLQRVERSAKRMESLITRLLDFTRARLGGGFVLNVTKFSLLDLVREVVDEHAPLLSKRRLEAAGEAVAGSWDRDRLAQVFSNLIGNAIQHSPDGSRIRAMVRREREHAIVEVWNEGPPIPEGYKLFEPFARATDSGGGLGLGLYIAHEIIRAHSGVLSVRSDGSGTTFTVQLPIERPPSTDQP